MSGQDKATNYKVLSDGNVFVLDNERTNSPFDPWSIGFAGYWDGGGSSSGQSSIQDPQNDHGWNSTEED